MVHCKHCNSTFEQRLVVLKGYPACPLCGDDLGADALDRVTGGPDLLPDGSNYDKYAFLNPGFTTDVAIFQWRRSLRTVKVLLIRRMFHPYKDQWALPGGFYDQTRDKTIVDIARRELEEETGLSGLFLYPGLPVGSVDRDPRQFTVTAPFASISPADEDLPAKAGDDASNWGWFDVENTQVGGWVAFDHATIIKTLLKETLSNQVASGNTSVLTSFFSNRYGPSLCTLPEARDLLRILGVKGKMNTTQHVLSWLVARGYNMEPTGETVKDRGRPAQVFKIS